MDVRQGTEGAGQWGQQDWAGEHGGQVLLLAESQHSQMPLSGCLGVAGGLEPGLRALRAEFVIL